MQFQSENLELNHGILRTLPVFGEIIVCLCKMIVDLTNMKCEKVYVLEISGENHKFCQH